VPVAGPPLVHDLGADLRLEVERCLVDDPDGGLHPLVLFLVQELGVFEQKLDQIERVARLLLAVLLEQRAELRVLPLDLGEEGVLALLRRLAQAVVVTLELFDVFADAGAAL